MVLSSQFSLLLIILSMNFPIVLVKQMGLYLSMLLGSLPDFTTGTTIAFFQSEGTIPVSQIFWNHICIEVLASFPACFKNSARIWSSPGDFLFLNCFIASWSSQSLIGESSMSSAAVGFALPFFCLRVLYSLLTIFEFLLVYVLFFCVREKVHVNVLAIPLLLEIILSFLCIGTLLLQEALFSILASYL